MRCDSGGGWCPPVEYSVHGISPGNPEWAPNSLPWKDIFKQYFGSNNKTGNSLSLEYRLQTLNGPQMLVHEKIFSNNILDQTTKWANETHFYNGAVLRKLAVKWDLNQKLSNETTSYWQYWII